MKIFGPMKIFGIAGWSGSGKTTLMVRLLPSLVGRGLRVATIKHTHHHPSLGDEEMRRLADAGATEMMMASPRRWALVHELGQGEEPPLSDLVAHMGAVDLVLVEGFKFNRHPKLEVWDPALGKPLLAGEDDSVVALASDRPEPAAAGKAWFHRDDVDGIADFIAAWCGLSPLSQS